MTEAIHCKELVEGLTEYLEKALSPQKTQAYDLHLRQCEGCQTMLNQLTGVIAATGQIPPQEQESELAKSLVSQIFNKKSPAD